MNRRIPNPLRGLPFPYRAPTTPLGVEPRPRTKRTGGDFPTDWSRRPTAKVARTAVREMLIRPMVSGIAMPTRKGADRLLPLRHAGPDGHSQPVIFAANHHSHLDTPLLLTSIPEPWRHKVVVGAAADYFFRTQITGALSALALGAFPIERTKVGRRSADLAAEVIDDGHSLLIFPEGGRSPDGWGQPFRGGAAYLALRCDVPVVPVHVQGTGRILPKGRSRPKRAATTVTFGDPIHPIEGERSQRLNERIEKAVAELGDETRTDWYQARKRAHADASPTMHGPQAGAWRRVWAIDDRDGKRRRSRRSWPQV